MDIHQHYQGLLEMFTKCGKASKFRVGNSRVVLKALKPPDAIWYEMYLREGALKLTADIGLGSTNEFAETLGIENGELDILIFPREIIRIDDPWNIRQSTIELAYVAYDMDSEKLDLRLALHFDFKVKESGEPDEKHPIFHAQLTHKPMGLAGTLQARNVNSSRMKGLPIVRLPTAHMTLPSVLLGVAADHFLPVEFSNLLGWMRDDGAYPHMINERFGGRMTKQQFRMRSCAWYADLAKTA
jgi:hypothetical protein